MFYGRKRELEQLEKEYKKQNSLCVIYGSRRIGKTSLINEFVKDKKSIMFQAKEVSNQDNLKSFSFKLLESFKRKDEYVYSSWEKAFDAAISFFGDEKGVIAVCGLAVDRRCEAKPGDKVLRLDIEKEKTGR